MIAARVGTLVDGLIESVVDANVDTLGLCGLDALLLMESL